MTPVQVRTVAKTSVGRRALVRALRTRYAEKATPPRCRPKRRRRRRGWRLLAAHGGWPRWRPRLHPGPACDRDPVQPGARGPAL